MATAARPLPRTTGNAEDGRFNCEMAVEGKSRFIMPAMKAVVLKSPTVRAERDRMAAGARAA